MRLITAAVAAATLAMTVSAPAEAAQGLTPAQQTLVYNALVADGVAPAQARATAADPSVNYMVPVPGVGVEVEITSSGLTGNTPPKDYATPPPVKAPSGVAPQSIGSCAGSGAWVGRTQYINNAYGAHIAYINLKTNFSYNGSRVTCAASTRTHYTYGWAAALVSWKGWEDYTEYFYTSGGHANGGALTQTTGIFEVCLVSVCAGSIATRYPWAQTRGYYNGSALTYGGVN